MSGCRIVALLLAFSFAVACGNDGGSGAPVRDAESSPPDIGTADEDVGYGTPDIGPSTLDGFQTDVDPSTAWKPAPVDPDEEDPRGQTSFWKSGDRCPPVDECTSNGDCGGGNRCLNTMCVLPIDPDEYSFAPRASFLRSIHLPGAWGVEDPGFDLDGDGANDHAFNDVLHMMDDLGIGPSDWSVSSAIDDVIANDIAAFLFEFRLWPLSECGPAPLSIWSVTGDLDHDGYADQQPAERNAGDGVFIIRRSSFMDHGARWQLNRTALDGGTLRGEWGVFPIPFIYPGADPIILHQVRFAGEVDYDADGVWTRDDPPGRGAIVLSGYIYFAEILELMNQTLYLCHCGEERPRPPLVETWIANGRFHAQCVQNLPGEEACGEDGQYFCDWFRDMCGLLDIIVGFADGSSGMMGEDGTTALDAVSVSALVSLASASINWPPVGPRVLAVPDIGSVLDPETSNPIDILQNDNYLSDGLVLSVSDGQHGTTSLDRETGIVYYDPNPGFRGTDYFEYSLLGLGERTTATVRVKTSERERCEVGGPCDAPTNQGTCPGLTADFELNCVDGVDEDCDGMTDCDDWDCFDIYVDGVCRERTFEQCSDGIDNDNDGMIDCQDTSCRNFELPCGEGDFCGDGIDNDNDGATDCDDFDCLTRAVCEEPEGA